MVRGRSKTFRCLKALSPMKYLGGGFADDSHLQQKWCMKDSLPWKRYFPSALFIWKMFPPSIFHADSILPIWAEKEGPPGRLFDFLVGGEKSLTKFPEMGILPICWPGLNMGCDFGWCLAFSVAAVLLCKMIRWQNLRSTPNDLEEKGIHSSEKDLEDLGNHEICIPPLVAPSIPMAFF